MKRIFKFNVVNVPTFLFFYAVIFPEVSYADFAPDLRTFVSQYFLTSVKIIGPILFGIAFLLFFWGVAKFILAAGNEKELAAGRQFMIWGIIGIFILVSFTGIMQFLSDQFGFGQVAWPFLPTGSGTSVQSTFNPGACLNIDCGQ